MIEYRQVYRNGRFHNTDPITKRGDLVVELMAITGEDYSTIMGRLHDNTSDCHGASRHSAETTWLRHQIQLNTKEDTQHAVYPDEI